MRHLLSILSQRGWRSPSLVLIFSLVMIACSPEGQWKRIVHPPHKLYVEQKTHSFPRARREAAAESLQRGMPGLPTLCKRSQGPSETPLCLECGLEPWLIQRCYDFRGKFEAEASCISSSDRVKCLMNQPLTTINISLKRSSERLFRENYLLWESKIQEVLASRLSPDESASFKLFLRLTGELSLWFSQKDPSKITAEDWKSLLPLPERTAKQVVPRCQEAIQRLQAERLHGKLSLIKFLAMIKKLAADVKLDPKYPEYIEALSLEGLEDAL